MKSLIDVTHSRNAESESGKIVEKILEFDILDLFWFEVLRRHPELQLDAEGKRLSLPRNSNIDKSLPRVSNEECGHVSVDIAGSNEVIALINNVGCFQLFNAEGTLKFDSVNLFEVNIARELMLEDGPGSVILSPLNNLRIMSCRTLCSARQISSTINGGSFRHSRYAVVNLVLPELVVVEGVVDPKKKKATSAPGPGKGAGGTTDVEKRIYYRVLIVDAIGLVAPGGVCYRAEVVHELLVDCSTGLLVPAEGTATMFDLGASLNSLKECFDGLSLDLSLDGTLLSVVSAAYQGGCKVFSLLRPPLSPVPINSALLDGSDHVVAATDGDAGAPAPSGDSVASPALQPLVLAVAPVIATVPHNSPFLASAKIKSAIILPNYAAAGSSGYEFGSAQGQAGCRLLLTLQQQGYRCLVAGFRLKSSEELQALQQQAASAALATTGKATKGAAAPTAAVDSKAASDDNIPTLDVCLLTQWSLASPLTAFALDPYSRVLLVTGCKDGVVQLWNLESGCLVDTLGRHKGSPVTCVSVRRNPTAAPSALYTASVTVVSGAADGTVCTFHATNGDNKSTSLSATAVRDGVKTGVGEHVCLCDYRFDAPSAAVLRLDQVHLRPHDSPNESSNLTFVQYSSGATAVYNIPFGGVMELLGRLEKKERIDFKNKYTSFYSWKSLPEFEDPVKKVAFIKAAEEAAAVAAQQAEAARLLAEQQAAIEAAKATKAATTKTKGPAPEAAPEAQEQQEEDPPPELPLEEPYKYVPVPEARREDQVDVLETGLVQRTIGDGCSSSQWRALCSVVGLSSSSIVCSSDRDGVPTLVAYSFTALLHPPPATAAIEAAVAQQASDSRSNTSANRQTSKHKLSNSSLPRTVPYDLKLTEDRLEQFERGFPRTATGTGTGTSAVTGKKAHRLDKQQQQVQLLLSSAADPASLMRVSVARSRQEKAARRGVLLAHTSALSSLLQAPLVQR